jgi:hypothetical protein
VITLGCVDRHQDVDLAVDSAVDHDDGRPVTMAFVGAAVTIHSRAVPTSGHASSSPK